MDRRRHWDEVYAEVPADEVSWFQPTPAVSLGLIGPRVRPGDAIVDVGGGASTLVDGLLARGHTRLTVLDLSARALEWARARLGPRADAVAWVAGDVLTHPFEPGSIDVWHDRAVFHFLTAPGDREAYVAQVRRAVRPGGTVIVATFAEDGPTRCSGLEVCRYSPGALHAQFGECFELVESLREDHRTPSGRLQHFQYCLCTLRPVPAEPSRDGLLAAA